MPGVRERRRAEVYARLLSSAKQELATAGAAGLSVRGVARAMDMAPSALFRYISGRDELLTLLIIDAYDALGDAVEAAEAAVDRGDSCGRWRAVATAFRSWALTNPHEYALLYGSPVPNFHAQAEETNRAGTRITNLLIALALEAQPVFRPGANTQVAADFLEREGLASLTPEWLADGSTAWTTLVGAVSAEVFQQLGPDLPYAEVVFSTAVRVGEELLFGRRPTQ